MTETIDFLHRWNDAFWRRFTDFTGWDPDVDQQFQILIGLLAVIVLTMLTIYVRQITRSSKKAVHRKQTVASYQQMRRMQNADDR